MPAPLELEQPSSSGFLIENIPETARDTRLTKLFGKLVNEKPRSKMLERGDGFSVDASGRPQTR